MSERINKLGHTISSKNPIDLAKSIGSKKSSGSYNPTFTMGEDSERQDKRDGRKSSISSDDEVEVAQMAIPKPENFNHDKKLMEAYTPSIGIIMGVKKVNLLEEGGGNSKGQLAVDNLLPHSVSDSNAAGKTATTPEITIHTVSDNQDVVCASNYNHTRNISHSSSEVDNKNCQLGAPNQPLSSKKRAVSEQDLTLSITSSQSESALKSIKGIL